MDNYYPFMIIIFAEHPKTLFNIAVQNIYENLHNTVYE